MPVLCSVVRNDDGYLNIARHSEPKKNTNEGVSPKTVSKIVAWRLTCPPRGSLLRKTKSNASRMAIEQPVVTAFALTFYATPSLRLDHQSKLKPRDITNNAGSNFDWSQEHFTHFSSRHVWSWTISLVMVSFACLPVEIIRKCVNPERAARDNLCQPQLRTSAQIAIP